MPGRWIRSSPYTLDTGYVVESEGDLELDAYCVAVYAKLAGTIKLSKNPLPNREHLLVASGGAIDVDGNGFPVVGPVLVDRKSVV